ncbi:MAG: hypothetical protein WBA76_21125 [Phormidesmis sp.]
MSNASFDPTHWSHWLLVGCFFCVSIAGLRLLWQWRNEAKNKAIARQKRAKLARFLAMELHGELHEELYGDSEPLSKESRLTAK